MANTWMPHEEWDALVLGDNCPLCREVAMTEQATEYGYTVADLNISRLRLSANQYVPGYSVLICHKHVREPYELSREERVQFFEDMTHTGKVLEQVYNAVKMNFEILGNSVPHLHCHIVPRYYGDPAPNRTINWDAKIVTMQSEEYQRRIEQIHRALDEL